MTRRDHLVERACRRAELLRAAVASQALQHPERPARGRPDDADDPRVVVEVVPPGEGDPQTEFYRHLTGALAGGPVVVKSMRVERR